MLPKLNSAHGSETRNIINRAIEVLNRLGIDMQTLVAEGQLTPAQYAELIKEVNGLISKGHVRLNDLSPEILEAINKGDGTPFEILSIPRKKSVSYDKTTFAKVISNNLYDGSYTEDKAISTSTGEIVDNSNNFGVTDPIPVEENTTYTKKDTVETGHGYYRDDGSFIDYRRDGQTFTTPPETAYVVIAIHYNNLYQWRLNLGEVLLPYDEYKIKLEGQSVSYSMFDEDVKDRLNDRDTLSIPRKKSVSYDKTTFLKVVSDNLYDGEFNRDKEISSSSGELVDNTNNFGVTDPIPVEENTTYTKKDTVETGHGYYRDDGSFILWRRDGQTFTTPPETAYVAIPIHHNNIYQWRLNLGDVLLPYDDYKLELMGQNVTYNMLDEDVKVRLNRSDGTPDKHYYVQDTVPYGWYEAPLIEGYADGSSGYTVSTENIYSFLDKLVDDDYVTSSVLGKDESGTIDIKRYDFKPKMMNINNFWGRDSQEVENLSLKKEYPKIIIHSGTHGEEKAAPVALAHFLDDLTRNWQSNPLLEFIRFNVHLIIVPVTNPYGYNAHNKVNVNGVDINKNFDFSWDEYGSVDPEDKFYKGTAPFSEVESQYIRDIILDNPDAMAFYDFHMNGNSGDEWRQSYWTVLKEFYNKYGHEQMQIIAASDINKITREAHERYDVPSDSGFIGFVSYDNPSNSPAWAFSQGIPSATIECTKALVGESPWYSSKSMQLNTEYIGNKILTTVRTFDMY